MSYSYSDTTPRGSDTDPEIVTSSPTDFPLVRNGATAADIVTTDDIKRVRARMELQYQMFNLIDTKCDILRDWCKSLQFVNWCLIVGQVMMILWMLLGK